MGIGKHAELQRLLNQRLWMGIIWRTEDLKLAKILEINEGKPET